MDPLARNQRQHLPPPPSINPSEMQKLLESQANTMRRCEGYYGLLLCIGPVNYQQHQHQYRAPSSGPSRRRNQRSKGSRKAEAQHLYTYLHESSGTIAGDRSTGIHPGHARISANDNTGAGKVWRTPSRNPLMADHNSTQQTWTKQYNKDRSSRNRRRSRTDKVDPLVYEIPIVESKRGAMGGGPKIPTPVPAMMSTWTTAPASSTPASAASMSTAYTETTRNTNTQKQPFEEDDFDTVSLGSNTD